MSADDFSEPYVPSRFERFVRHPWTNNAAWLMVGAGLALILG